MYNLWTSVRRRVEGDAVGVSELRRKQVPVPAVVVDRLVRLDRVAVETVGPDR
jgi:hypothetical protein